MDKKNHGNKVSTTTKTSKKSCVPLKESKPRLSKATLPDISRLSNRFAYNPHFVYCYQEDQNKNFKQHMEDISLLKPNFQNNQKEHLFGIFDGHGGVKSAQISLEKYPEILSNCIRNNPHNLEKSLTQTFTVLDKETLVQNCIQCGNTATIVYINGKMLYWANVGDSKCILVSKKGGVTALTKDDKCTDESEVQRIKAIGGRIINNRVDGCLAITRAIGDHGLKDRGLICIPHLGKHFIGGNGKYCIIASDGVWDVLTHDHIRTLVNSSQNEKQLADNVVNTSLSYGSKDNISCIVIGIY